MASIADLWDEKKYSEGDPIRQLIGASKSYKDWPVDALAWGADLVDLGSSGLAKVLQRRPELARMVRTDLGGNLRRAFSEPRQELGMSEGPAPDVESGRSVGRMLNPALLFAGNQRIPMPANRFSEAKRQFILGKNKAFEDAATDAITKPTADLLRPIDEVAQTPVDRRTFLKGAAAVGAGAIGGGLLSRFGKAGKIADDLPKTSTHKYNSLKEYLDDVRNHADDIAHERSYEAAMESGYNSMSGADRYMDNFVDNFDTSKVMRDRLLSDEEAYKTSKFFYNNKLKDPKTGEWIDPFTGQPHSKEFLNNIRNTSNDFSPQAKKEMKEYKEFANKYREGDWHRLDDIIDWTQGDRIPF